MYYAGTISTVSGSAIVRGTGTQFISNINGVAPGQIILIRSGNNNLIHMIQAVNSDTELVLADTVPVTLNNVKYQIQTTVPDSVSDGVRHILANTSYITLFLQNMDKWMSQDDMVEVTLPNGQTVSLQSIKALYAAIANAYPKTGGTITGHVDINAPYGALRLNAPDRNSGIFVEFGSGNNRDAFIGFGSRDTKTFTIHNDKTNAKLQINEYATFNENKLLDMGDIASHTGSSPKTVMSQKSTTEAINRHASLGINQQWRDVTDNRRPSVAYKNNTDRPICLSVTYQELVIRDWYALMALNINGRDIAYSGMSLSTHEGTIESRAFVTGVIPPGASYSLSMYTNHDVSGNLRWYELS